MAEVTDRSQRERYYGFDTLELRGAAIQLLSGGNTSRGLLFAVAEGVAQSALRALHAGPVSETSCNVEVGAGQTVSAREVA